MATATCGPGTEQSRAVAAREEQQRAVAFLIDRIGRDRLSKLRRKMSEEGPILDAGVRYGLLQWVVNALLEGGFRWDAVHCYEIGMDLLHEAAFREAADVPPIRGGR